MLSVELKATKFPYDDESETKELFMKELGQVEVPGLFVFATQIKVSAGMKYFFENVFAISAGFVVDYPFKVSASANGGIFSSKPKFTYSGVPTFAPIVPKLGGKGTVTPKIIPEITMQFAFNFATLDLNLAFDNELELKVEIGDYTKCPDSKLNLQLHAHNGLDLGVGVLGFNNVWSLWSRDESLVCMFCNRCPAISLLA